MSQSPIRVERVSHAFGEGALRQRVLFDVSAEIGEGEIVILTGPSGSGKTTLLSLIGALRSAQEGSLCVLGRELRGADEVTLADVRRQIGYIFQAHNLLDSLTARQNVQMSLELHTELTGAEREQRAADVLGSVGLMDRIAHYPNQLSGGERQRVAVARALASRPKIVLADEPTAALDKENGRAVVELIQTLARERGVTVVLVTHDSRILDVADRILALEDGRLASFMDAVASNSEHLMRTLAADLRKGALSRRVARLEPEQFSEFLHQVTEETQRLLGVVELVQGDTFTSVLEQILEAFASKVGEVADAERATLYLLDDEREELWSLATCEHGAFREIRLPLGRGIAGHVATTAETLNVADAQRHPLFDPGFDLEIGCRTENLLSVPIADSHGHIFAVAELANKHGDRPFDESDEQRLTEVTDSLALICEAWWRMSCSCRAGAPLGHPPPCCITSPEAPPEPPA